MWNSGKSVTLSSICTKLVMVLVVLSAILAPKLVGGYLDYTGKTAPIVGKLLFTIYASCIPALGALFCLDRLLSNIRRNEIFISGNVIYLRWISWCCFGAALILLLSGFYYILFVIAGVAAAFFGLIIRVVKNVIQQAVSIKRENDYTI